MIPPGTSAARIGMLLERQRVVRSRYAFDAVRFWKQGTLKAGEYRFADAGNVSEVYSRIRRGDVYTLSVTIPEGYNLFEIAQAVQAAKLAQAQTFLNGARANVNLIADLDPHATSLEGYLYPDTYKFAPASSVLEMQRAMVERFRAELRRLAVEPPVHDLVTLASLVEKETGQATDRGLVASVFANRLAKGMPLDTDPTVIYAAELEGRYRGTIYASDLKADSSYNTYLHAGLPPGPICSPGVASLRAAMHPAATNYLYFVADADGKSKFATTLDEQNRNVAAYRKQQHQGLP